LPLAHTNNSRIFINADAEHARVLRDRAQQSSDPSALGEVLVNDHVLRQPEPRRHMKHVADLADSSARTADQHHLAQRRGARRGSAYDSTSVVNLLDSFGGRRAPQTRRDLELISAPLE